LTFALLEALRGFVPVVYRIQFRSHQQKFLHLKQTLRFSGFELCRTVLKLEGASHEACSCMVAGRFDEAVDVSLVLRVVVFIILSFLIGRNLTVEVSNHSLDRSARTQWQAVGVKRVNVRWHRSG